MRNYLPDRNRFGLAKPPDWWLRALWEFDSSLVIIPSRAEPIFRICQRRPLHDLPGAALVFDHPDALMTRAYLLVPVTSLSSATQGWQWNTLVFKELGERCGWRNGLSPEATAALVDRHDAEVVAKRHADRDDRLGAQIRWSETVAKWHTGRKILLPGETVTASSDAIIVPPDVVVGARSPQRGSSAALS